MNNNTPTVETSGDFTISSFMEDDDWGTNNTTTNINSSTDDDSIWANVTTNVTTIAPTSEGSNSTNSTNYHNDAAVLKNTFSVYGTALLVSFLVFCWVRLQFPGAFNVRRKDQSTNESDKNKNATHLAENQFGFLSWLWKIFLISDDDFMDECGLDALCFVRLCSMGYRLTLVGMFISIWLLPVYGTAEEGGQDDATIIAIDDPVVEVTTGNVPTASHRLVATAIAMYFVCCHAMYVILQEFQWFIRLRHKFLRKSNKARNFSVYVRNVPVNWRSNRGLTKFFEKSIRGITVLESHVCLHTTHLKRKVSNRKKIVERLEHAVAVAELSGKRPTHNQDRNLLDNINKLLIRPITVINNHITNSSHHNKENGGTTNEAAATTEATTTTTTTTTETVEVDSIDYYTGILKVMNQDITNRINALQEAASKQPGDLDFDNDGFGASAELSADLSVSSASPSSAVASKASKGDYSSRNSLFDVVKANTGGVLKRAISEQVRIVEEATGLVTKTATGAVRFVLPDDDGEIHSAGFISFQTLSTTNAALQMIHHEQPYTMEVQEAPDPDDIYWANIGREHQDLQIGRLLSLAASAVICLFWTLPVSFVASLSSVSGLRKEVKIVDEILTAAPALEPLFQLLAPQLLVILNALLPLVLRYVTNFEGSISGAVTQASLFVKLGAFTIIQTFFVSAISGSIWQELREMAAQPELILELLATSLPAQSTYFIQISFVSTFSTFFLEALGFYRVGTGVARSYIGPNLTPCERKKTHLALLRPLSDPRLFEYGEYMSSLVLLFMVYLVYSVIAPLVSFVLAFCFVLLGALFRHQFIYVYPPKRDSGGRIWMEFIRILTVCLLIAELTVVGLMALKKSVASMLLIPLLVATAIFSIYLRENHFDIAEHLPTRLCLSQDRRNKKLDFSFLKDAYLQPEMREKQAIPNLAPHWLEELGFNDTADNNVEVNNTMEDLELPQSYQTFVAPHGMTCRVTKLEVPSGVFAGDDSSFDEEEIEVPPEEEIHVPPP